MSLASLLLLTASLAGPAGEPPASVVSREFAVDLEVAPAAADQVERRVPQPARERRHTFGLGGSVSGGTGGLGGAFRYWFGEYVGVDFSAVWSRPQVTANARASLARVTPSVIVMLRPASPGADLDLRPFVGGGLTWAYSSYPATPRGVGASASGVGGEVYGGAEMVFADAPSLTISAQAVYSQLPNGLYYGNSIDGFTVVLAFHYYLR